MASPVVVIVFQAASESIETLAMSAAVGAVQARALIRLRCVPDADAAGATADRPADRDAIARMQKEYVPPTEADVLGADGLLIVPPPGAQPTSTAWQPFVSVLERLAAEGRLAGKVGGIVQTGDAPTMMAFGMALLAPGLIIVPTAPPVAEPAQPAQATEHGRRVGELARTLKPAS